MSNNSVGEFRVWLENGIYFNYVMLCGVYEELGFLFNKWLLSICKYCGFFSEYLGYSYCFSEYCGMFRVW